jgi:hypothetical protein
MNDAEGEVRMTNDLTALSLKLLKGNHKGPTQGACVLEAVAYIAGEEWSDHPKCACPVIAAFARRLNDRMTNEERVALVPLIPLLAGSRADQATEIRRGFMASDWAVRTVLPELLDELKRPKDAAKVRALEPLTSRETARSAREATLELRRQLRAYAAYADAYADAYAAAAAAYAADAAADAAAAAAYAAYAADAAADAAYAADAAARLAPARKPFMDSAVAMLRTLLENVTPIEIDDAAWERAEKLAAA